MKSVDFYQSPVSSFLYRYFMNILYVLMVTIMISGCNFSQDPMVESMQAAYARRQSDEDVNEIVRKRFPPSMTVDGATKAMQILVNTGFKVKEYRNDSVREWPHGAFHAYGSEAARRQFSARYSDGSYEYVLTLDYDRYISIYSKSIAITLKVRANQVVDSSGHVNISLI